MPACHLGRDELYRSSAEVVGKMTVLFAYAMISSGHLPVMFLDYQISLASGYSEEFFQVLFNFEGNTLNFSRECCWWSPGEKV